MVLPDPWAPVSSKGSGVPRESGGWEQSLQDFRGGGPGLSYSSTQPHGRPKRTPSSSPIPGPGTLLKYKPDGTPWLTSRPTAACSSYGLPGVLWVGGRLRIQVPRRAHRLCRHSTCVSPASERLWWGGPEVKLAIVSLWGVCGGVSHSQNICS
jgi:hypothetical protein